jgi:hypothetical protein
MPGTYPDYSANTQDTKYDIPGRLDIANAADYNDHDREILAHQAAIKNHSSRLVTIEAGNYSGYSGYSGKDGHIGVDGVSGYSGYSGLNGSIGINGSSGYSGYSGGAGSAGQSGYSGYSGAGLSGYSGYSGLGTSGYSGYSGSGLSGYSGYSGRSGYSGYSGSGLSGYSGYSGAGISGYSGYSGSSTSGYSGYSGTSGYSGYSGSGISGYSGYSGSGLSGYSGYSGKSGYSGYSGSGVSGYSGYSGSGLSGYSGYSGKSGYSGYSGAGLSGYSGYSGSVTSGMFVPLGTPTDGSLTDGIHAWTTATLVTDALDDCNETLSYLAPADAGSLTGALTMSGTTKYAGYLSAGNTNYKTGEGAGTSVAYIINDPTFTLTSPSTTTAFNKSDEGTTNWYKAVGTAAYGAVSDSVDNAASFDSANRGGTQTNTPWTTGQISVTSVGWYNGFPKWQKGNAVITVTAAQLSQGYNKIKMTREGGFTTQLTSDYEVFYDNDVGANPSVGTVTVAENTPANRKMSGVNFYTRGSTFNVSVVGSNCFDNTYAQYPLVITSSSSNCMGNASVAPNDATVSDVSNPPAIDETMTVTNKVITVPSSSVRSINAQVTVTPSDPFASYTAGTSASANRLVDAYLNSASGTSTDIAEYFDTEWYRMLSNFDIDSVSYSAGGAGGWDSTVSLVSGTTGYDGLQVINGAIQYPSANYTSGYLPAGSQVDYSGASGSRVYIRYFYVGTGKQNFTWTVTGTTITFVSVATGVSASNLTFEMLAPAKWSSCNGVERLYCCIYFRYGYWLLCLRDKNSKHNQLGYDSWN